jgi:hypothetical protein
MQFDSADLATMAANGTLYYVVLHEMGHVLGIGTLWNEFGLKSDFYNYVGQNALAEYRRISGNPSATSIPLETTGGSGTAGVHWSEAVFGNEVMTGYISPPSMPLSSMSIASLRDLGYAVNWGAAEGYTMPGHLSGLSAENASAGTDTSQLASGFDNVGTLGFDTAFELPTAVSYDGSGAGNPALLANYIASTFATSAVQSSNELVFSQASDQQFLTKPAA